MTCAQVARYLRMQKRVKLEIHRPDYELLRTNSYHRSSSKRAGSLVPHSYTFSTISDLQVSNTYCILTY